MASFTSSPISAIVNSSGTVLTLTGIGTTWAGTPFSLPSGVSGCSITAQTVFSATSASITIAAGPQIGIVTISDGTNLFNLSIAPNLSIVINQDNFKRANTGLGGVGAGTLDVLTAWEIASNQARTTNVTGNLFTGRLYWPTQFADGTFRIHFGPGYTGTGTSAIMLFARAQGQTSTSQAIGFFVFPGLSFSVGQGSLFSIAAGSTGAHTDLKIINSGVCPTEGWIELITSGSTMTGNVYQSDGVTLVTSITYTGLTGTYLSAGYAGVISYNFNNFMSEYDAWETINITAAPPFMPLTTTTPFAVTGQATNFSGSPFTVVGVAGCSIVSQVITDATHAIVTIASGGTAGNLILTDTGSGASFSILVTATPQIALTPVFYKGNGTVSVAITGINVAFFGTPFVATGTPSALVASTIIIDGHNAVISLNVGPYAGILTITDSVSGASATFQVYHPSAGTLTIGFIGDSITFGTNGDPVTIMCGILKNWGYTVTQVNRGIGGKTSTDWGTNAGGILTAAIAAIAAANCNWVQIMLGTNDAKTAINTSPATYLSNLTVIVNACLAVGAKVVLNQPIWTVPGAVAGTWLQGANTNYQQYYNILKPLVDNQNVFYGDTLGLDWFENNPLHLLDGVHPTAVGDVELGGIWSFSFWRAINPVPTFTNPQAPVAAVGGSSQVLNRAQLRDAIRRKLNITPPIDLAQGNIGDQPANRGNPSNFQMNDAIQEAVYDLNRRCNFHVNNNINISVPAISPSVLGPYEINLNVAAVQSNPVLGIASINDVRRAEFIQSGGAYYRLEPTDYREVDLARTDYKTTPPGTPRQYWIEGYKLYVYPSQAVSGVINLICGTGLLAYQTDEDVLSQIPLDYQDVIQYLAIQILMSGQTMDKEAKERMAVFAQLAEQGVMDVNRWKNGNNGEYQPSMKVATYRVGPESLRNRR